MRKLLLIMGDLAAGKSTFANILSQRYRVALFSKDTIKEILGDTIGFLNSTLDVYEDFKKCAEQAQKEVIPGKILTICADDFSYQNDESILKEIDAFMLD